MTETLNNKYKIIPLDRSCWQGGIEVIEINVKIEMEKTNKHVMLQRHFNIVNSNLLWWAHINYKQRKATQSVKTVLKTLNNYVIVTINSYYIIHIH